LVALVAARAMHDDLGASHGGFDTLVFREITSHGLDTLVTVASAPAEHSDVAAGLPKPRNNEPPQRPGAACDQDGWPRCGAGVPDIKRAHAHHSVADSNIHHVSPCHIPRV